MLDQNFLFMAFLMLCFAGLATMFYFMMRNIDDLARVLKDDRNQMLTNLRALESSINHLGDLLSRLTADQNAPRNIDLTQRETMRPLSGGTSVRPFAGSSPSDALGAILGGPVVRPEAPSPLTAQNGLQPVNQPEMPQPASVTPNSRPFGVPAQQPFAPLSFDQPSDLDIAAPIAPATLGTPAQPCPPGGAAAPGTAADMPSLSLGEETSRRRR